MKFSILTMLQIFGFVATLTTLLTFVAEEVALFAIPMGINLSMEEMNLNGT